MGHACLAYACALVLLCPLALSQPEVTFGKNYTEKLNLTDEIQNNLVENNETTRLSDFRRNLTENIQNNLVENNETTKLSDFRRNLTENIKNNLVENNETTKLSDFRPTVIEHRSRALRQPQRGWLLSTLPLPRIKRQDTKRSAGQYKNFVQSPVQTKQFPAPRHRFGKQAQASVIMMSEDSPTTKDSKKETNVTRDQFEATQSPVPEPFNVSPETPLSQPVLETDVKQLAMKSDNSPDSTYTESRLPFNAERDEPPLTRRKVGMIIAHVGTLLVKQVPEDTFFDLEDGSTRNLALSMMFADRKPVPHNHWMQFDVKRQEFYGLPGFGNIGIEEYILTARDKNGGKTHHLLNVKVMKAPPLVPHVEFYLTMDMAFMDIAYSARHKRKLIETIALAFGHEHNTSYIRISSLTDSPTTVKWYNTTLPADKCPQSEIKEIFQAITGDTNRTIKDTVEKHFEEDFKLAAIAIVPLDECLVKGVRPRELVSMYSVAGAEPKLGASGIVNVKVGERKLVSFVIPTIVIAIIIFTCLTVLYLLFAQRIADTEFMPCLRVF